jgi:hypothetical protein
LTIAPLATTNPQLALPREDMLAFLTLLGRPGMRLFAEPGGRFQIRPSNAPASAPATTMGYQDAGPAEPVLRAARQAGYLCAASRPPVSEVLSVRGRQVLQHALMIQSPAATIAPQIAPRHRHLRRRQGRDATLSAAAGDQPPSRQVERMALIEQLAARKDSRGLPLLTDVQVRAGLRLAQDFLRGQMQPRVTARWSADAIPERRRRGAPGAGVDMAEATSAAQERVRAAVAVMGGALADVALDVTCYERGLEAIEAAHHWPPRTARIVLGLALTRLAEHYGLISPISTSHPAIRQWGTAGFVPSGRG